MNDIVCTQTGGWGLITLSRPQALNALHYDMVREIMTHLLQWRDDPDIHAVMIHSAHERAFCAGGDIRQLYEMGKQAHPALSDFFRDEYNMNACIHDYPKPYVALMDGITMGGGVGVSLHAALPIASDRFQCAMPETAIGFFPDIGASYLLSRLPGSMGEYLALTGARLDAGAALALGLVAYAIPHAHIATLRATLLALDLADDALAVIRSTLVSYPCLPSLADPIPYRAMVDGCFAAHSVEAILTALAECGTDWALTVRDDLLQKSPMSLKVTLEQIRRARTMDLRACLDMDYRLVQHFLADHDFYEGVRAMIIDKDKQAQWSPRTLDAIDLARVRTYFTD